MNGILAADDAIPFKIILNYRAETEFISYMYAYFCS